MLEADIFQWSLETLEWMQKKIVIQDYTLNFKHAQNEQ